MFKPHIKIIIASHSKVKNVFMYPHVNTLQHQVTTS